MRALRSWVPLAGIVLTVAVSGYSQSYDLSWFTVDGGGGTSTGGVYAVSGTIGQPDAGTMSGGNYSLTGGFWSALATVKTGTPPELTIAASAHVVIISWPSSSTGFSLEQTPSLGSPFWKPVSLTVNDDGTTRSVTISPPVGTVFYRLTK